MIKAGQQNRQSSVVSGNGKFHPHARVIEQLKTIIERYLKEGVIWKCWMGLGQSLTDIS